MLWQEIIIFLASSNRLAGDKDRRNLQLGDVQRYRRPVPVSSSWIQVAETKKKKENRSLTAQPPLTATTRSSTAYRRDREFNRFFLSVTSLTTLSPPHERNTAAVRLTVSCPVRRLLSFPICYVTNWTGNQLAQRNWQDINGLTGRSLCQLRWSSL